MRDAEEHCRPVPNHLILVACHAIYSPDIINTHPENPLSDIHWLLSDFQQNEPPIFAQQLRKGFELHENDPRSYLALSGGRTREETQLSEAFSYFMLASDLKLSDKEKIGRVGFEIYARDSMENVLFGIAKFYQEWGIWPEKMTVISWEFKRERFGEHWKTVRRECEDGRLFEEKVKDVAWEFVGVGAPVDLDGTMRGEMRAMELFKTDPFGLGGKLMGKKIERDPHKSRGVDSHYSNVVGFEAIMRKLCPLFPK